MARITKVKVKYSDSSYSGEIPIGASYENILIGTSNLKEILGGSLSNEQIVSYFKGSSHNIHDRFENFMKMKINILGASENNWTQLPYYARYMEPTGKESDPNWKRYANGIMPTSLKESDLNFGNVMFYLTNSVWGSYSFHNNTLKEEYGKTDHSIFYYLLQHEKQIKKLIPDVEANKSEIAKINAKLKLINPFDPNKYYQKVTLDNRFDNLKKIFVSIKSWNTYVPPKAASKTALQKTFDSLNKLSTFTRAQGIFNIKDVKILTTDLQKTTGIRLDPKTKDGYNAGIGHNPNGGGVFYYTFSPDPKATTGISNPVKIIFFQGGFAITNKVAQANSEKRFYINNNKGVDGKTELVTTDERPHEDVYTYFPAEWPYLVRGGIAKDGRLFVDRIFNLSTGRTITTSSLHTGESIWVQVNFHYRKYTPGQNGTSAGSTYTKLVDEFTSSLAKVKTELSNGNNNDLVKAQANLKP